MTTVLTYQKLAMQQPMLSRSQWYADVYWDRLEQATANVPAAQRTIAREQAQGVTLMQAVSDLLVRLNEQGVEVMRVP